MTIETVAIPLCVAPEFVIVGPALRSQLVLNRSVIAGMMRAGRRRGTQSALNT